MPWFWLYLGCLCLFGAVWLRAAWRGGLLGKSFHYSAQEGLWIFLPVRLLVLLSLLLMVQELVAPGYLSLLVWPLGEFGRWLGLFLALGATALFQWVFGTLGRHFSTSLHIKEGHELMTDGPYRYVRHPMYGAYHLMWLAIGLLAANWLIWLSGFVAFSIVMISRTPKEEAMLLAEFGEAYRQYQARTGRYLPRIRRA